MAQVIHPDDRRVRFALIFLISGLFPCCALAEVYFCPDGFYRNSVPVQAACRPVTATINKDAAFRVRKSSPAAFNKRSSLLPQNSEWLPAIAADHKEFFSELFSTRQRHKSTKSTLTDGIFESVPHPQDMLECVSQAISGSAAANDCSQMILQKTADNEAP